MKQIGRTKWRWKTASRAGLLASAALLAPALAYADAPATPHQPAVEEVIVTAQKRRQSAQKIGLSITALGSAQLKRLGVKSVTDIAAQVPGFTVAKSFRGPPIYTIRGVGFNTPNLSTTSPVQVYLDEVAYPFPIETEGLAFDLERVEVLKGPQGTLYGRNTTGGLINEISNKPTSSTNGEISVGYGSYGEKTTNGFFNAGISPTLQGRLAFDIDNSNEGWQTNVINGTHLGKIKKEAVRGELDWEPTPDAKFHLSANWWHDGSDTQAAQSIYIFPKGLVANGIPQSLWTTLGPRLGVPLSLFSQAFNPSSATQANWDTIQTPWGGTVGGHNFIPAPAGDLRKDNQLASVTLRSDIDLLPTVKLTSLTSYTDFLRNETVDPAGIALENGLSNERGQIQTFSQEVRLAGETTHLSWIAGLSYAHDAIREIDNNWGATTTDIDPLRVISSGILAAKGAPLAAVQDALWGFRDWRNQNNQAVSTRAIFGQTEWRFAPRWSLITGLRYNSDNASFDGCSQDRGDNSIAATWNAFFINYLGIPSNVAPGGCVTYLANLTKYVVRNPRFVPLAGPPEFLLAPGVGAFPGQGIVQQTLTEDNLSGRLGLDWQATPNMLAYAYFARGYKSGAFPNVSANVATQYSPAQQERVLTYEVGLKTRPFGNVTANGSLFYYDYRNKQVFGFVPDIVYGSLNRLVNIPQSHLYGGEFEISAPIWGGFVAQISGDYIRTQIDQYSGFDDFGVVRNFKGASYAFTPKYQFSGVLSYGFDVTDTSRMTLSADAQYSGEQHGDLVGNPLFNINPYFLMNLHGIWSFDNGRYEFGATIKNVTDKYYWTSTQLNEDSLVRYAGKPRIWGVSLKVRF